MFSLQQVRRFRLLSEEHYWRKISTIKWRSAVKDFLQLNSIIGNDWNESKIAFLEEEWMLSSGFWQSRTCRAFSKWTEIWHLVFPFSFTWDLGERFSCLVCALFVLCSWSKATPGLPSPISWSRLVLCVAEICNQEPSGKMLPILPEWITLYSHRVPLFFFHLGTSLLPSTPFPHCSHINLQSIAFWSHSMNPFLFYSCLSLSDFLWNNVCKLVSQL